MSKIKDFYNKKSRCCKHLKQKVRIYIKVPTYK